MFVNAHTGSLVRIAGTRRPRRRLDPFRVRSTSATCHDGRSSRRARSSLWLPARAALAALDSTARQLPIPTMLRTPALRREAQSTSALEGTYAPLTSVFTADEDEPASTELVEILNYVRMADQGFSGSPRDARSPWRCWNTCRASCMRGTPLERQSGTVRDTQVVIGRRSDASQQMNAVHAARFIPPRPVTISRPAWATSSPGSKTITPAPSTRSSPPRCRTISSRRCTLSTTATGASAGSSSCCT